MSQVYLFPQKKKLPSGMEEELRRVAKEYVETLYAIVTLFELESEKPTYDEVMEMVAEAFHDGIYDAIGELEES